MQVLTTKRSTLNAQRPPLNFGSGIGKMPIPLLRSWTFKVFRVTV
jgi:hypothetical protein